MCETDQWISPQIWLSARIFYERKEKKHSNIKNDYYM